MSSVDESMSCHGQLPTAPVGAPLTVAEVRRRLEGRTGPQYWRSLEEIARQYLSEAARLGFDRKEAMDAVKKEAATNWTEETGTGVFREEV